MDTEQIEQRMRVRRAAIDAKLDLLARQTATARRFGVGAIAVVIGTVATALIWTQWRRRRAVRVRALGTPRVVRVGSFG